VGTGRTLLLGAIAGVTILLGMPLGRMKRPAPRLRQVLNATAIGVLLFLLWDVLAGAFEPIDEALSSYHEGHGGLASATGYGLLFFAGLTLGLMTLIYYERRLSRVGKPRSFGPGTMAVGELEARTAGIASWSPARRLALLIAVGIGLHNFAEGLAIGQSAASGEIALATVLVIGFGLHNATEGFGIVAPLAADEGDRPSWALLGLLGLIAGGPTFVGAVVGHGFTSEALSVLFLSLAAGSILYVVVQLITVAAKARRSELLAVGLLIGLLAGFATDAIITAAGV
jgi:ZIP family zinc transporter